MTVEGAVDNQHDGSRNFRNVENEDTEAGDKIQYSHEWNDCRSSAGNTFQSAEDNDTYQKSKDNVGYVYRYTEGNFHTVNNSIYLSECTNTEKGNEDSKNSK